MQIYFSVIYRSAPIREAGEIVSVDWNSKRIKNKAAIWPYDPELDDPNPRGNTRGGRGIAVYDGKLIAASYHSLHFFDFDLNFLKKISHPLMVNIHEVENTPDGGLWVAATGIDAALKFDLSGNGTLLDAYWPRENRNLQKALGLEPLEIDKQADNRGLFLSRQHLETKSHTHLNATSIWGGDPYALLNSHGAVVNLQSGEIVIHEPDRLRGAHNLVVDENEKLLFINNTFQRSIHIYDLDTYRIKKIIALKEFPAVLDLVNREIGSTSKIWALMSKLNRTVIRRWADKLNIIKVPAVPLFVRGLALAGSTLFIGVSPASIIQIDWRTGELIDIYQYSDNVHAAIHGIYALSE